MSHFIPVAIWLCFASSARQLEVANDPMLLLPRMTRVCNAASLLWWGVATQAMFTTVWFHPGSFWYAIPLIASLAIVGSGMIGAMAPSGDYQEEAQGVWWRDGVSGKWPLAYRTRAWQLDLATELMGDEARARLEGLALASAAPKPQKQSQSRRL